MKIGELGKATGLTTKTIRFYEAEGLLPDPGRTNSGYRVYRRDDAKRLEFIRKAKRLGLSLEEIRGILLLHDRREPTCVHVRLLLDQKLAQIAKVITDLQEFHSELATIRDRAGATLDCGPSGGRICGIIEGAGLMVTSETVAWIDRRAGSKSSE